MTGSISDQGKIAPPLLPAITFINGPQPLATEVANMLSDIIPQCMAHSFEEPLRNAANGLFFYGDPSIDIGTMLDKDVPLPSIDGRQATYEDFLAGLHTLLIKQHGADVLGALATREAFGFRAARTGIARAYIDGTFVANVDTYVPAGEGFQNTVFAIAGLPRGLHTLTIEVTGERNPAATNNYIGVDAFDVQP